MGKVVLLIVIVASERVSEHSVLFHDQRSSCPFVAQKNNRRVLNVFTSMVDPAYLTSCLGTLLSLYLSARQIQCVSRRASSS